MYRILVGKPLWKRQLERLRKRCEASIMIDLRQAVRIAVGCNWLRIVSSGWFWYQRYVLLPRMSVEVSITGFAGV
jgi:hypothetical protein